MWTLQNGCPGRAFSLQFVLNCVISFIVFAVPVSFLLGLIFFLAVAKELSYGLFFFLCYPSTMTLMWSGFKIKEFCPYFLLQ